MIENQVKQNDGASTQDRELVFTRVYNAPRVLVYEAWTDPKHLANWWGPQGFTITVHEIDFRPGGAWRFVMHGPDGTDYDNKIVYTEVAPPERLAYTHGNDEDADSFQTTVTFAEQEGKTELTMRMLFKSAADMNKVVQEFHAIEGANSTLTRLGEHLAAKSVVKKVEGSVLTLERIFDAPRELVFEAYKAAEHLKHWWGPKGWTLPVCNVDFRPGGVWHYCMKCEDESQGEFYGMESWGLAEYHEIVEPERIVYTDYFSDAEGNKAEGMPGALITMTFVEHEGKTKLISEAQYESAEALQTVMNMGMIEGITQTFDRLEDHLQEIR